MYPTNVNIGVVDYIHFDNDVSQFNLNVLTRLSFLCLLCVFHDCTTSSHYYDFFLYIYYLKRVIYSIIHPHHLTIVI